ncbi:putative transcription factor MYB-HB-like family [Helianthus annuus]|nr:putative transcription factor MYB-HB-like family [Helianthus annuus]
MIDVNRASQNTLSNLKKSFNTGFSNGLFNGFKSFGKERANEMFIEGEETVDLTGDSSDLRKLRRVDSGNGGGGGGGGGEEADSSARTSKRPRLVWTPQLNKRFVGVVAHLGVKKMVLKTIMQLMNVEGLTHENAASHLQKYRLYLKPMQGLSNEGPSSSDHLFASTPVPQSLQESSGNGNNVQIPMPYPPHMVPMPYTQQPQIVQAFESHSNPFNMMMHQRDWSGNKYAYQDRMTNDK